jgi:heme/copper-type cytochrome/quinol oxidase subunit 2
MPPVNELLKIGLLLSPVFLIQVGMAIYALIDLRRRAKTRGPRWAWALALIVTILGVPSGIIVSGVYLAWGRHAEA